MCRSETKTIIGAFARLMGLAILPGGLLLGACASNGGPAPFDAASAPPPVYGPPPAPVYGPPFAEPAAPVPPAPMWRPRPLPAGLLPAPPAEARPGECFARVRVPGEAIPMPPAQPHAVWVLTPPRGPYGSPMWCLYLEPGAQPPPQFTPERFGWIRVVCDQDATTGAIRHVQRRLRAWGYYDGAETGAFDGRTAGAVRRFQMERRIEHGGYLSVLTMDALDQAPPITPEPPAYGPAPGDAGRVYDQPMGPALMAPGFRVAPHWACPTMACPPVAQDGGRPPYLSWPGKSVY